MPRTKLHHPLNTDLCLICKGTGDANELDACETCSGNGYVPAEATIHDALQTLRETERSTSDPLPDHHGTKDWEDVDLTNDTPPPGRMANQTWRILEEQRQAAEDTVRECENEIERWTNKMVDAMKTKGMCEAGQRALEGGVCP